MVERVKDLHHEYTLKDDTTEKANAWKLTEDTNFKICTKHLIVLHSHLTCKTHTSSLLLCLTIYMSYRNRLGISDFNYY